MPTPTAHPVTDLAALQPHLGYAVERELAAIRHHRAEAERQAASGFGVSIGPYRARSLAELADEARRDKARGDAFAASPRGEAVKALNDAQAYCERLHGQLEAVRSALSREDGSALRAAAGIGELLRKIHIATLTVEGALLSGEVA